eukprot:gene28692-35593_t
MATTICSERASLSDMKEVMLDQRAQLTELAETIRELRLGQLKHESLTKKRPR